MTDQPHESASLQNNFTSCPCSLSDKLQNLRATTDLLPVVIIVHDMENAGSVVYMSPLGQTILGFSLEDLIKLGPEYHNRFFNPEDVPHYKDKVFNLMMNGDDNLIVTFFQQARPNPDVEWKWYLTSTRIFHRNNEGRVTHLISTAMPIDSERHITAKVERLLAENSFLRSNQHVFASLSNREKEVLKMMALGHSASEIAWELDIAENTVTTHRRNIKSKLNARTNYDVTFFAQAFSLV
jgi:DNA-binding CsgD family transcriptional regulator